MIFLLTILDLDWGKLTARGYDGYYTLEWPLKHDPGLVGAEVVYPQYIEYMRN